MVVEHAFMTALELSIIPIMIMIALSAIAYMLSKLIKYKEFEIFAKMELYQILISLVLLITIILGTQALFEICSSIAGNDPFTIALEYLEDLIGQTYKSIRSAFWGRFGVEFLSKISVSLGLEEIVPGWETMGIPLDVSVNFPPTDLSTLGRALDKLFAILSPFYASLAIQQFALSVIKAIMISLILPVGIFLRVFPTTRNSGSFLIAVAIGFYIVFPFTYVVHSAVMEDITTTIQEESLNTLEKIMYDLPASGAYNVVFTGIWGKVFGLAGPKIYELFKGILMFPVIIMQGLFLPTISMAITISFINSFQKFLIQRFD